MEHDHPSPSLSPSPSPSRLFIRPQIVLPASAHLRAHPAAPFVPPCLSRAACDPAPPCPAALRPLRRSMPTCLLLSACPDPAHRCSSRAAVGLSFASSALPAELTSLASASRISSTCAVLTRTWWSSTRRWACQLSRTPRRERRERSPRTVLEHELCLSLPLGIEVHQDRLGRRVASVSLEVER